MEHLRPFGTTPQVPQHPGKGTESDRIIQLNCGEVHTHASYKTIRKWENFNNRGTKIILRLDKLWLIVTNFKGFANKSNSIIRNIVGWCKRSDIYVI